jgi:putative ABC transport system substrate-binding protein
MALAAVCRFLTSGIDMHRRDFMMLGGAAAAWPLSARAQQPDRMRRIGILMTALESDPEYQSHVGDFRKEFQTIGWTEGRNLRIDYRWGAINAESRQQFARELVAIQPDAIFSQNTPTSETLYQETRAVPIVFVLVSDPIGAGLVASFPRPGGNVTGFIAMEATIAGATPLKLQKSLFV